jgi:hypothetical protein
MKNLINKSVIISSKLDSNTIRVMLTIGSMIIFSLIAGAPLSTSGNGG